MISKMSTFLGGRSSEERNNARDEFDTNLPTTHSYLGHMDNLHGYTLYDEGAELEMLGLHTDTLVLPGYTLPLLLDYQREIDIMRQYMTSSKTFVLICASTNDVTFTYGITMEIIEVSESDNTMALKAKGRQRCKITDFSVDVSFRMGKVKVKILPEINLSSPLNDAKLPSLNKCRKIEDKIDKLHMNEKLRRHDASQLRFPLWVYNQFELPILSQNIQNGLAGYGDCLPSDPVQLSFWFAQNFQLNHDERLKILKLDSAAERLRLELFFLKLRRLLCCANCGCVISRTHKVFAMSKDGVQSNYCNPGGHVYETLTVTEAINVTLVGHPSEQFSWFPGYAWTIAQCKQCRNHLGWLFTSKKLKPKQFWGLARNCITAKIFESTNE